MPMDERTPLVNNAIEPQPVPAAPTSSPTQNDNSFRTINLLCLSLILANSSAGFFSLPLTQLLEDSFCLDFRQARQSEVLASTAVCKDNWVQTRVADTLAVSGGLDAVFALLASLPWGVVADSIGRKPIVILALFGVAFDYVWWIVVLALRPLLPIWAGWFGSASMLIGGGASVLAALFISTASDATDDSTRATAFMRLHVASMLGLLISPSLASTMMKIVGPWPVLWMAVACLLFSGATFMLIRETERVPLSTPPSGRSTLSSVRDNCREVFSLFKTPALVLLLLTTLLSQPILLATTMFLPQFISKRYDIEIQSTGYIQTAYGAVQAFQALVGLPILARYMLCGTPDPSLRRLVQADTERKRDRLIGRWSFLILLPGLLLMGFAPHLWSFVLGLFVLALGSGYSSYTKSLMSLYVGKEHQSTLFSLVAMTEVLGAVYSGFMYAELFSLGIQWDGVWMGLPYFVIAVIAAFAVGPLFLLRLPGKPSLEDAQCEDVS